MKRNEKAEMEKKAGKVGCERRRGDIIGLGGDTVGQTKRETKESKT